MFDQLRSRCRVGPIRRLCTKALAGDRCQSASRSTRHDGVDQAADWAALPFLWRAVQPLDAPREICRQRNCAFVQHSMPRMRARERTAVEPEPGDGIDELTVAVNEVRDPQRAVTKKDRYFASLASAQELSLDGMGGTALMFDRHGRPRSDASYLDSVCSAFACPQWDLLCSTREAHVRIACLTSLEKTPKNCRKRPLFGHGPRCSSALISFVLRKSLDRLLLGADWREPCLRTRSVPARSRDGAPCSGGETR